MTAGRWLVPWLAVSGVADGGAADSGPVGRGAADSGPVGRGAAGAGAVLLCLPPAGSGCGQYAAWRNEFGPAVGVVGVQLPGRENRFAEPMPETVTAAVGEVAAEIDARLPAGRPLVLFGQSLGGLLAYELARCLGDKYGRWPAALVVAACRAPHLWVGAGRGLVGDDAELSRLLDLRGLGADELDEDSRALMLDVLRADARLSLTYADPGGARVPCPLYAWGGETDDVVTAEHLDGWAAYAAGPCKRRKFPGGHYFPAESAPLVVDALRRIVVGAGTGAGAAGARAAGAAAVAARTKGG